MRFDLKYKSNLLTPSQKPTPKLEGQKYIIKKKKESKKKNHVNFEIPLLSLVILYVSPDFLTRLKFGL
jgi:hypothetical protein